MKYLRKFQTIGDADGYIMRHVPFLGYIPQISIIANKKIDRQLIVNEEGKIEIPNTIILPDEVLKFSFNNRIIMYDRTYIAQSGRYPEYNKVYHQDSYGPMEYVYLHVILEDGTEQIIQDYFTVYYRTPDASCIPHTTKFWVEINIPSNIIPGGWYAKSNIISPYYSPDNNYWLSHTN